jgi:molybdopterin synthase catalytic subunit
VRAWITTEPIAAESVLAHVGADADGATALFLGVVRDHNDGRPVRGVRYSAYDAMAQQVLSAIAAEATRIAQSDRVAVVHRTGELAVGEASVAIAVSAPHRAPAFDACRHIIEEIKKRLPVWKEELYADGGRAWLEGTQPEVHHG